MADEQFEWLDRQAAERMLRGEPVEASDEHARIQAARLSRALYEAGRNESPGYAGDGEMPGEAAALAAFRKARADAAAPAGEAVAAVRLAPSHRRPARRSRFGRPVRFGLAAAFAGCALGGAAVAATTGLLPSPFGGDPLPASSVTAAATPEPLVSDSPTGGGAVAPPNTSGSPSTPLSPSPSDGSGAPTPPSVAPTATRASSAATGTSPVSSAKSGTARRRRPAATTAAAISIRTSSGGWKPMPRVRVASSASATSCWAATPRAAARAAVTAAAAAVTATTVTVAPGSSPAAASRAARPCRPSPGRPRRPKVFPHLRPAPRCSRSDLRFIAGIEFRTHQV